MPKKLKDHVIVILPILFKTIIFNQDSLLTYLDLARILCFKDSKTAITTEIIIIIESITKHSLRPN